MSESLMSNAKESAMDALYMLVGGFVLGYIGNMNFVKNMKYGDELLLGVSLGTAYYFEGMVRKAAIGGSTVMMLRLVKKYLGIDVL